MSRFFVEFLVWQYPKTLQGNPSVLCCGKFQVANKFLDEKGGGVSKLFVKNFLSLKAEKIRRGTL